MAEPFLIIIFKVIWQDLVENIAYDSTKQHWQVLQVIIDEIKSSKQVNQDLAVALEKCCYSSDKTIAEKCFEELINNSTYTQYRGAKIYKPPENDVGIKKLENKIKFLEKELKQFGKQQFGKKLFAKKSSLNPSDLENFLKEISQSSYEVSEAAKKNAQNQLLEQLQKNCDVNVYNAAIKDEKNGLRKLMFQSFLIDIEPNEHLNRIFSAKTYLILNKMGKKV